MRRNCRAILFKLIVVVYVLFVAGILFVWSYDFRQFTKSQNSGYLDISQGLEPKPDDGKDTETSIQEIEVKKRTKSKESQHQKSKVKLILLWSTWSSMFADELLVKARCPVTSCLFTCDVSLLSQSDVVVVNVDTMTDFPWNREPHQRFVFYQLESPIYTNEHIQVFKEKRLRYDYFNWTMTYRRDSDIILRDYYGSVVPKMAETQRSPWMEESNVIAIPDLIKGKTKMVAWFVSHCSTPIRREEYARQLGLYVSVDVFGKCTGKDCSPYACDEMLRAQYKFYLAFENSWCPDYVTEKFYRALVYDAVPIALGGADYSWLAPPHSYINARDFNSPKELAAYLMLLDKNDDQYARYFDWKKDYDVNIPDMGGWCDLCRMAHDNSLPPKVYHDIEKWWMVDGGECETNSTKYF